MATTGKIRVAVLLLVLFVVVLYALKDLRSRRGRNHWDRTLDVAVAAARWVPETTIRTVSWSVRPGASAQVVSAGLQARW